MIFIAMSGRLLGTPETKKLPSGKTVCNFRLESVASYRYEDGEPDTLWLECQWFGDHVAKLVEGLDAGSQVIVTGKLRRYTWQKNGENKHKFYIAVESLHNLQAADSQKPQEEKIETPF